MSTTSPGSPGTAATAAPVARSVEGAVLLREIQQLGITHVITVPDTHQKTLLELLAAAGQPRLLTVCTEDEAIAINAGLYIGGQRPMLLIQNNGLLASINALKAIALEARVPTFFLVGQFARDVTRSNAESPVRAVRMVEPTMATWGVPCYPIEGPEDVPSFARAYRQCLAERGPAVVLLGAPTS
jgi:sulfopyruvate decarboxylase TPP-binding subunit